MSESFNHIQLKREWQEAIEAFDRVFIPYRNEALSRFINRVLDYLDEHRFEAPTIVSLVCMSYLSPGDPEAEDLNQSVIESLRQVIATYENSIQIED